MYCCRKTGMNYIWEMEVRDNGIRIPDKDVL